MKIRQILVGLSLLASQAGMAQTDVTKKYLENPDFEARFAAWVNPGSFTYNVASSFGKRNGQVWLEKWVSKGSTLNNNDGIHQTLRKLPTGTYTLVAAAQNISQNSPAKDCTGAFLYAGPEQTEISQAGDYSVTFTVVNGKADIGVRLRGCTGNWVCIDNFRLYYNGENADSIQAERARLEAEEAALRDKIASASPSTTLKVTTYPFVPTGNTIALGRATFSGTSKEKGFCWSTSPQPTIFDEKTSETFSNNGDIYVMRGLDPATPYYVRPYAMNSNGCIVYGSEVKIVTLPAGNMTYGFFNDNNGDAETCARINSASAECVWMYNNLSYIPGFYLSVHYVPGAGASGGTADCSYGGWMRVSQNVPYQQTGTMLHETNHGVGVGTTGEWYNNANLRASTSSGQWLGPMGTRMVRFFENSTTATMTGDGTHMWPYGINGAHEDSYQPSNQCLYYANILITHALHQDGLPSTSGVGFASPAYVFEQRDTTKYYIKSNDPSTGLLTGYLYATTTGIKWNTISGAEAKADDSYAWYIKYDPQSRYYYFQNVGNGKMITYNTGFKLASRTTATNAEKLHLMPARTETTIGSGRTAVTKTAYWVMQPNKYSSQAMEATSNGVTGTTVNLTNGATRQQWIFLTSDELASMDQIAMSAMKTDLTTWLDRAKALMDVPHRASSPESSLEETDAPLQQLLSSIDADMDNYDSPIQFTEASTTLQDAIIQFLDNATPENFGQPFDLTFLIQNPGFDKNATGWSGDPQPSWGSNCCEYYQKNFDFNQTIDLKMPKGLYELRVQAFQRPGTLDDLYLDYYTNQKDKVNATIYLKSKTQKVQNICAGETEKSLGTGSTSITTDDGTKHYIPNSMASAQSWFKKEYYENSVWTTTMTNSSMKFGIKSGNNAASGWWTLFDNFRLYFYGSLSQEDATPVQSTTMDEARSATLYDLTGRQATRPARGIYVKDGRKVVVK